MQYSKVVSSCYPTHCILKVYSKQVVIHIRKAVTSMDECHTGATRHATPGLHLRTVSKPKCCRT